MPEDFWDMTWRELDYLSKHKRNKDYQLWDIARTIGSWILAPHTKRKIKPKDLLKLPSTEDVKVSTFEDFQEAVKRYNDVKHKITN